MTATRWLSRGLARLLRATASAAVLAALLGGLPWALAHYVGNPLPQHVPTVEQARMWLTQPLSDTAVLGVLACLVWVLWAAFLAAVIAEVPYAARGLHAPRLRGLSPMQAAAAMLIASMTLNPVSVAAAALSHAPPPTAAATVSAGHGARPPTTTAAIVADAVQTQGRASARGDGAAPARADQAHAGPAAVSEAAATLTALVQVGGHHYRHPVVHGDTLWDLAAAWLHNPLRWHEITVVVGGVPRPVGGHWLNPRRMLPGTVLQMPADATPPPGAILVPAPHPPTAPPQSPPPPAGAAPSSPSATPPATTAPASPRPDPAATTVAPAAPAGPGVAGTPSGTGPAAASPSPTAHVPPSSRSPRANPPGITLPGGSWVDLGLATAIVAAAAVVWLQRRRRYVVRPVSPDLRMDDPDLAPMPPIVLQIRRGLRLRRRTGIDAGVDLLTVEPTPVDPVGADPAADDPDLDGDWAGDDADADDEVRHTDDAAGDDSDPDDGTDDEAGEGGPGADDDEVAPRPVTPALGDPLMATWPPAGLGLTGPGGEAAARGFLVGTVSAGKDLEPEARHRVVIPSGTLATLVGTGVVGVVDTPRLTVTPGLAEALEVLEEATLHRTRVVYDHEVDTVSALRDTDPMEEPLAPLLLIADAAAAHERTRIVSLLAQGQRLDIHGVLVGEWAAGNTVRVEADGATSPADGDGRHGEHPADVGRLSVVTAGETAALLRTFAEAQTGLRQPTPPLPAAPSSVAAAYQAANDEKAPPAWVRDPATVDGNAPPAQPTAPLPTPTEPPLSAPPTPAPAGEVTGADEVPSAPAPRHTGAAPASAANGAADADAQTPLPATAGAGRAVVFLLGPPRVDNVPPPSRTDPGLRPQALELLVYLVVHGGSAHRGEILEDVLGDAPRRRAPGRLSTFVYSLRRSLKAAAGGADGPYVGPPEDNYRLHRERIDLDLWRMQDAIVRARAAADPGSRVVALREAVACYAGPLAQGKTWEWIDPYREAVRAQAVDAHLALVDELSAGDPAGAVTVLRAALEHEPHRDELYQQAMRLYARLGDVDGVREMRRVLTRRLGDIDAEPSPQTLGLADQLITDLQQRPRQPRRLRGDAA